MQERGTYFIVPDDQRYTDLIQIHEPFEHDGGWKKGALVTANVGKGRWIFVGLGLWRQVTAGTDGAFQLPRISPAAENFRANEAASSSQSSNLPVFQPANGVK